MDKVRIRLSGPAKIGGKVHPGGAEIDVDPNEVPELEAVGLVDGAASSPPAPGPPWSASPEAFERAVAETAKVLAETMVGAIVGDDLRALEARAIEAEVQRDLLQGRVLELQAALADRSGEPTKDTRPPTAAKTARKGAAANKG